MGTRFKADPDPQKNEVLGVSTIFDEDKIQLRHSFGTADDSDKGVSKSVLQTMPIAVCSSGASTLVKVATIENFPDFTLISGREVIVYMENGNTNPDATLNINNTGNYALEGKYWNAGTFVKCKFVNITVNGVQITKWLVDTGAYNQETQLNGALMNYIDVNVEKRIGTYLGNKKLYKKFYCNEFNNFVANQDVGLTSEFQTCNIVKMNGTVNFIEDSVVSDINTSVMRFWVQNGIIYYNNKLSSSSHVYLSIDIWYTKD